MIFLRAAARARPSRPISSIPYRRTNHPNRPTPTLPGRGSIALESLLAATNNGHAVRPFAAAAAAATRRRRRPRHKSAYATEDTSIKAEDAELTPEESREKLSKESRELIGGSTHAEPFAPKTAQGEDMPMDEYLELTSLSPWVPVPDVVARRALDVAEAGSDDVHYELGSGDGRVCFHAVDSPYHVKKTVGVDIDPIIVEKANERLTRRHPRPENVEFVCADLLDEEQSGELWENMARECTVLTMYFVEEALQKIKPKLEEKLGDSECRIVTVGYKMRGWEPRWDETNLGLPIYMYVLKDQKEEHNRQQITPDELDAVMAMNEEAARKVRALFDEQDEALPKGMLAQEKLPEPEAVEYYLDPNESVDFDWDFDEKVEYDDEGNPIKKDDTDNGDNDDSVVKQKD